MASHPGCRPRHNKPGCDLVIRCCVSSSFLGTKSASDSHLLFSSSATNKSKMVDGKVSPTFELDLLEICFGYILFPEADGLLKQQNVRVENL